MPLQIQYKTALFISGLQILISVHFLSISEQGWLTQKYKLPHDLLNLKPSYRCMTFFFQANTIRVILNTLALPTIIIAVNGSPKKVSPSIIKVSLNMEVCPLKARYFTLQIIFTFIFLLQKHIDSLQKAFINPPKPLGLLL